MTRLLTQSVLPTAVFAEYDELAIGAIWAIRQAGLAVPRDISVISIDDHEMAAVLDLTTVAQDAPSQGRTAAELLIRILEANGETLDLQPTVLPTRLILRGSTAPPLPAVAAPPTAGPAGEVHQQGS